MHTITEVTITQKGNFIHLLSGGLDSSFSLLELAEEFAANKSHNLIFPIFFDYGHQAARIEWKRVKSVVQLIQKKYGKTVVAKPIKISLKSDLFQWTKSNAFKGNSGNRNAEIENRNMVLFSVLASYLLTCANNQQVTTTSFTITSGFRDGELFDCNQRFFTAFEDLLKLYKPCFTFSFKFLSETRHQIIEAIGRKYNEQESEDFLRLTTSCYDPGKNGEPCGICHKCVSIREEAENQTVTENKIAQRFNM